MAWAEQVNAIATVIAACAAVGIPIVLARTSRREEAINAALELSRAQTSAMREIATQWQAYNLAVAGNAQLAEVVGHDFGNLNTREVQELHVLFFKLTGLHQLYYTDQRRLIDEQWALDMVQDIGLTCFQNEKLAHIALADRGYSDDFIAFLKKNVPSMSDAASATALQ